MQYQLMSNADRDALLARLAQMPDQLEAAFAGLNTTLAATAGEGAFTPVEQCWHLADLEREGFALRIHRIAEEAEPQLADFDGGRIAAERRYREKSLSEGLAEFRQARSETLALLKQLPETSWIRRGHQEGVGW